MLNKNRIAGLLICVSSLSACTSSHDDAYTGYQPYTYDGTQLYPEGYENTNYSLEEKHVVVPDSYHVSAEHSPTSHKDIDREWVNQQNAEGYTIELATGDKASQVANTLQKAPKNERMAEVKYERNGKIYYKGLYGTYKSREAAEQALGALPPDVKQNAGIKTWSSIQSNVDE